MTREYAPRAYSRLGEVAPRLGKAQEQIRLQRRTARLVIAYEKRMRRILRDVVLHKEQLVAHRDLQLARAWAKGKRGYIIERERKLRQARRELDRAESRLSDLEGRERADPRIVAG